MYAMHPLTEKKHFETEVTNNVCCDGNMQLAQAYVCPQKLDGVFPPEEGLRMGTIFPCLSQPYAGRRTR